jgi:HEAT repeat protein
MDKPEHDANKNLRGNASDKQLQIKSFIDGLGSKDKGVREKSRQSIISIGKPAAESLVHALANPNEQVRWEASKLLGEIDIAWSEFADSKIVHALIDDLTSKDGRVRVRARRSLVAIGGKAVADLVEAMKSEKELKRWEATKALGQIGDPSAIGALITALEDEIFDVRWLAAEGLVAIGKPALEPLLHMLIEHFDSIWLHEGAHHILHEIQDKNPKIQLRPVLRALENVESYNELPSAAQAVLKSLK